MDGCKTCVRPVTYNAKSMSIKTVEVCNFVYLRDYGLEFSKAFFLPFCSKIRVIANIPRVGRGGAGAT